MTHLDARLFNLTAGAIFLFFSLVAYKTGKFYGKGGVATKKEDPFSFWFGLIFFSVIGILLILYSIYQFSSGN